MSAEEWIKGGLAGWEGAGAIAHLVAGQVEAAQVAQAGEGARLQLRQPVPRQAQRVQRAQRRKRAVGDLEKRSVTGSVRKMTEIKWAVLNKIKRQSRKN